jgi:hypothetical protein
MAAQHAPQQIILGKIFIGDRKGGWIRGAYRVFWSTAGQKFVANHRHSGCTGSGPDLQSAMKSLLQRAAEAVKGPQ